MPPYKWRKMRLRWLYWAAMAFCGTHIRTCMAPSNLTGTLHTMRRQANPNSDVGEEAGQPGRTEASNLNGQLTICTWHACRPTPTVTSVKKQTNTTKCGRCLTCRTPSRKQACLIGRCKDLAEKGSATARLAAQGNDLKGMRGL